MLNKIDPFLEGIMVILFGYLPLLYTTLGLGYLLGYAIF